MKLSISIIAVIVTMFCVTVAESVRAFDYNATPSQNWNNYQSNTYPSPAFGSSSQPAYNTPSTTTYNPRSDGGYSGYNSVTGESTSITPLGGGGYSVYKY